MEPGQNRHRERNTVHIDSPRHCFMVVSRVEAWSPPALAQCENPKGVREQQIRPKGGGTGTEIAFFVGGSSSRPRCCCFIWCDTTRHPSTHHRIIFEQKNYAQRSPRHTQPNPLHSTFPQQRGEKHRLNRRERERESIAAQHRARSERATDNTA